jgi:GT2 family glycosyltransferase
VRVSVVIPAFNERARLRLLLLTLGHNAVDPTDSFEVVVADDGSTDGTDEMVTALSVRCDMTYVHLPRTERSSRAAARNAAVAKATGDLVLMVDADQVVGPTFVAEHIRFHRLREDLVVIGPRPDLGAGVVDDARLARGFSLDALPAVAWGDPRARLLAELSGNLNGFAACWHQLYSCNASVRLAHLDAAGGFDEAFLGWGLEDAELGYRLRRRGLAFAFNAAATAYHQNGRRVDAAMFADWSRNLAYMVGKHGEPEVAVQSVVGYAINPADRRLPWLEAARRLEFAARGLAGRLPAPPRYELLTVGSGEDTRVRLAEIRARSAETDLLVIDYTPDAALAGPVQCTDTARELLYFHRPSPAERSALLDRYPCTPRRW